MGNTTISAVRYQEAFDVLNKLTTKLPRRLFDEILQSGNYLTYLQPVKYLVHSDEVIVTEEIEQHIDTLLGPHGEALFRAWVIQRCTT